VNLVAAPAHTSAQATVVIVDCDPLIVLGTEQVALRLGLSVVGKATTAATGVSLLQRHQPRLLIADAEIGDGRSDGLSLIGEARRTVPGIKVIVLGRSTDSGRIQCAFDAGASVYVLKSAHPDDLASAIRQTFEHSVYLPLRTASQPAPLPRVNGTATVPARQPAAKLTSRELEVLQLVVEGASNSRIAQALWVTEQTVKFHLTNVYRKLGVANRTEASRWATLNGVVADQEPRGPHLRAVSA
jgi:DNA-binding NarL/FixJ family response regulator